MCSLQRGEESTLLGYQRQRRIQGAKWDSGAFGLVFSPAGWLWARPCSPCLAFLIFGLDLLVLLQSALVSEQAV